ncbi:MAG TPA: DUF4337 domain-containing protein, partial [Steroidobacteraceae bacterium]|nr:DUF4337 domain-containing protein [Steroidobacteraceae bacterium]
HGHEEDRFGKIVGVIVGVIGILLAAATILSHRAHTEAVIQRTEVNDQWSFFQSKKIREHALDIAITTLTTIVPDSPKIKEPIEKFTKTRDRYAEDTKEIETKAHEAEHATHHAEEQALRFDLGEGLLELGMVLSSLYFLSKRKLFPYVGISAAVVGVIVGSSGLDVVNELSKSVPWYFH